MIAQVVDCSYVSQISRVTHPVSSQTRVLVVLIGYFDDSVDGDLVCMAGYVSTAEKWEEFERRWKQVLAKYGISFFHMKEYAHRVGEFSSWPEERRISLMKELVVVIQDCVLYGVAVAISAKDYESELPSELKKFLRDPYYLAVYSCLTQSLHYHMSNHADEEIAFVWDEKSKVAAEMQRIYAAYKSADFIPRRELLGSLTFADDKKFVPLQAADLLAYEYRKYHEGWARRPMDGLNEIHGAYFSYNRENLVKYAKKMMKGAEGNG